MCSIHEANVKRDRPKKKTYKYWSKKMKKGHNSAKNGQN